MKFLCTRTKFALDGTSFWSKNKIYSGRMPSGQEFDAGIRFYVETDGGGERFVSQKEYARHFRSMEEVRQERIGKILGDCQ